MTETTGNGPAAADAPRSPDAAAATDEPTATSTPPSWGTAAFVAVVAVAAILLVGVMRLRPPAPLGVDAPHGVFSEARARTHLAAIVATDEPRPMGSVAHARSRDVIVARFRAMGYETDVSRRFGVVPSRGIAAWTENVVARLPGKLDVPPILVTTHYDSVGAGPGAADDAMSVAAALEVARILREGPTPDVPVEFLVTDGEEAGLLGAREHLRSLKPGAYSAVLNFEARGNRGVSLCFETGPLSGGLVDAWARHASRPTGSSLFAAIYDRMPNDTDFSVFKDRGLPGLNFAGIGRVHHYHTPLDTVANVDPGLLQHQGDNMLAAIRGASDEVAGSGSNGDVPNSGRERVWFDVLGVFVVSWGASLSGLLAAVAVLLVVIWIRRDPHALPGWKGRRSAVVASVAAWPLAAVAGVLSAHVAGLGLGALEAVGSGFPADPRWCVLTYVAAAALGTLLVSWLGLRWTTAAALAASGARWWAVGAVLVGWFLPGASYLCIVPAMVGGGAGAAATFVPRLRARASQIAAVSLALSATVVAVPFLVLVGDALGVAVPVVIAVAWMFVLLPLAPFLAGIESRGGRFIVCALLLAATIAGGLGASRSPLVTEALPGRLTLTYRYDPEDPHSHLFLAGDAPAEMKAILGAEPDRRRIVPWQTERGWDCNAPRVELKQPVLADFRSAALDGGGRRVTFRLTSARGAPSLWLALDRDARVRAVTLGGTKVPAVLSAEGYSYTFLAVPAEGVECVFEFADAASVRCYVGDATAGLPAECAGALRLRPRTRVPSQDGDRSVSFRKLKL